MSRKRKDLQNAKRTKSTKSKSAKIFGNIFAEVFEMPEELAMDLPRITLIGNIKLSVENHKGIMEYSENQIKLKVNDGFLTARGNGLALKNISPDEVLLEGEISRMAIMLDKRDSTAAEEWEV